jgi:hypothetical protein
MTCVRRTASQLAKSIFDLSSDPEMAAQDVESKLRPTMRNAAHACGESATQPQRNAWRPVLGLVAPRYFGQIGKSEVAEATTLRYVDRLNAESWREPLDPRAPACRRPRLDRVRFTERDQRVCKVLVSLGRAVDV